MFVSIYSHDAKEVQNEIVQVRWTGLGGCASVIIIIIVVFAGIDVIIHSFIHVLGFITWTPVIQAHITFTIHRDA